MIGAPMPSRSAEVRERLLAQIRQIVERHNRTNDELCSCGWRRTPRDPVYWSDHVAREIVDL